MTIEKFIEENEDVLSILGIEKKLRIPQRSIPQAQRHNRQFPPNHRKKLISFFKELGKQAVKVD